MLVLDQIAVRTAIRDYLLENFLFSDDPSTLSDMASFQDTRLVDSMGMIQIIQFLESTYALRVLDHEMVPDNLDSVDRLVRFVITKTTAA